MDNEKHIWITGFWRRLGALFIDGLILGFAGFLLGLLFEDYFVQMSGWGRLVGFSIALLYFGILNSAINKGQTVGKAIVGINVVDSDNNFISLPRSFARYCILAIPFYLNNARFTEDILFSPMMFLLMLIVIGCSLSIIYLYIFNRKTRQSLHDVIVGTYVTNINSTAVRTEPVWRGHYGVVAILLIGSGAVPYFTLSLAQQAPFADMLKIRKVIMNETSVVYASVYVGTSVFSNSNSATSETEYIAAQAFIEDDNIDNIAMAENLGSIIVNNHAEADSKDLIQVILTYGYDIGIWSSWKSYKHQFVPGDFN